jgi:SPP1 family predicted phage head-tail adaptor
LIDPGKLDRRVTLQSASVSTDGFGQAVRTYSTLAQVWAQVEYRGVPKEGEDTEKLTSVNRVRFTIRYRSDVDATTKISWKGNTYEVEGVSLEGRERYLILDTVLRD